MSIRPKLVCYLVFAFLLGLIIQGTGPAHAQTSVSNTVEATVVPPVIDPNLGNNSATSTVAVGAPSSVRVSKATNKSGSVVAGEVIRYTVTVVVTRAPTREDVTLRDTLGAGLSSPTIISSTGFNCSGTNPLTCVLPAGSAVGTYTLIYDATVLSTATGSVRNAVVVSGGEDTQCTTTNSCSTTTPVTPTAVDIRKTSATAGPVNVGQLLTYTLTAVVTNSRTTADVVVRDTLSTGLTFVAVVPGGSPQFTCTGAVVCTLASGTAPGTYTVSYTARVNDQAGATVTNGIVVTGNNPNTGCIVDCAVVNPVVSSVGYRKLADTAGPVAINQLITFTIRTVVKQSATTQPFVVTDTLGAGLELINIVSSAPFTCVAPVVCTLPTGTAPGTYDIVYRARVLSDAVISVRNDVTGTGANSSCDQPCSLTIPLVPSAVSYGKRGNGPDPTVQVGDLLTYALRVTVSNSTLPTAVVLTDTIETGLDFIAVTDPSVANCVAPVAPSRDLVCTVPALTPVGTYDIIYTTRVNATALGTVRNTVVATGGGTPTCAGSCTIILPLEPSQITYAKQKFAGPATVAQGDLLTFRLTAEVKASQTTADAVLVDTLGSGLVFTNFVAPTTPFNCVSTGPSNATCTLPSGTAPGIYFVDYVAEVDGTAQKVVTNSVVGTGTDGPVCSGSCSTSTPVGDPEVTYGKTSSSGAVVSVGDVLTYTLDIQVFISATDDIVTLVDTLSDGLLFTGAPSTSSPQLTCDFAGQQMTCILATNSPVASYSVTYSAVVQPDALGVVTNAVVGTGTDNPVCSGTCSTSNDVAEPLVSYGKTSTNRPAIVKVGDIVEFTLTVGVENSQTLNPVTLTDTTSVGYEFVAITANDDGFVCNNATPLVCVLPAGAVPGTYDVSYTMLVTSAALSTVTNTVVGGGGDNPSCAGFCDITIPVLGPEFEVRKVADTVGPVKVNELITYTLTTVVSNSQTRAPFVIQDTPGAGLAFVGLISSTSLDPSNPTVMDCVGALVCTLPIGAVPDTYVVVYSMSVTQDAEGTVDNGLSFTGGPPSCVDDCEVIIPVVDPRISYSKTSSFVGTVMVGDEITYTVTTIVDDAKLTGPFTLVDMLSPGLTLIRVDDAGAYVCTATPNCTLPAGTFPGSYPVTYTARVTDDAVGSVKNGVVSNNPDATCDATGTCEVIINVTPSAVSYSKSADTNGPVEVGDTITYTIAVVVENSQTVEDLTLVDTMGPGLTFGQVTSSTGFNCTGALTCVLPTGTVPGNYTLTYTALVNDQATDKVSNAVVATKPGTPPTCIPGQSGGADCSVEIPVEDAEIFYSKVADTQGPVEVGEVITYTIWVDVLHSKTTEDLVLTDTIGDGLDFTAVTFLGDFFCNNANPLICTLAAGAVPGAYRLEYTATVNADALRSVRNAIVADLPDANCPSGCVVEIPVLEAVVDFYKVASTAGPVQLGDVITYTLSTEVQYSQTEEVVTLSDTLGAGLDFIAITDPGDYTCVTPGPNQLVCTLPIGTIPGLYNVTYTAGVNLDAVGTVNNAVVSPDNSGNCVADCDIDLPVRDAAVLYSKSTEVSGPVDVGDVIPYTLTAEVLYSTTATPFTIQDQLGTGLTFVAVTDAGIFQCTPGNPLVCVVPAGTRPGTYDMSYTARVNDDAVGMVRNNVLSNDPNTNCGLDCEIDIPVEDATVLYYKSADTGGPLVVQEVVTYTLWTVVEHSQTTEPFVMQDTLGTGLAFGTVTDPGPFNCISLSATVLQCTLPTGTPPGTYSASYTAMVELDALTIVNNSVVGAGSNPICRGADCEVYLPILGAVVEYQKTARNTDPVNVGDVITYDLVAVVKNSKTIEPFTATDTLGTGLTFGSVQSASPEFVCTGSLVCVLATGTYPGTYTVTYTATVNNDALNSVKNSVLGDGSFPICLTNCEVEIPMDGGVVAYSKAADTAGPVSVGDLVTYTVTAQVKYGATDEVFVLTDTMGTGLTFVEVVDPGPFTCVDALVCTLPIGTVPGTYNLVYTARVNDDARSKVSNVVVGTGSKPECNVDCDIDLPLAPSATGLSKTVDVIAGATVKEGDVLTYTITATVVGSSTLEAVSFTDTLGDGLTFGQVISTDAFVCNNANPLQCVLPIGTTVGTHNVVYTATVNVNASVSVNNRVVSDGSGGETNCTPEGCEVVTPVESTLVRLSKSADPGDDEVVEVGQTITYTLAASIERAALSDPLELRDTPGEGLRIDTVPAGCTLTNGEMLCVLPVGTPVGQYSFTYEAVVGDEAEGEVSNNVVGRIDGPGVVECDPCSVEHGVNNLTVRLTKVAGVRLVKVGDLVRYTLTVENLRDRPLVNASLFDNPAEGFSYVEGSLVVVDEDNYGTITGYGPMRIDGIDIAPEGTATVSYLMRVGANVRQGVHVNTAITRSARGTVISNSATAQVEMNSDPLFDDSLLFGTVFHDRDGDGWHDPAVLGNVKVKGGFAPGVYVSGTTTMERGDTQTPVADASAPLLAGMQLGNIAGRTTESSVPETIIIRQHLTAPQFADDFVLTNDQGLTLRMNAAGHTTIEKSGEAAAGRTAAEPLVERNVSQLGSLYVVDYIIRNNGVEERGLPGVRIATVEGLIMETDQFGRYHLTDIEGGAAARGRNFIMKVDPVSLPAGAEFTTENPVVRRITSGLPTRFDWGVRFTSYPLGAEASQAVDLELGEVAFAPGQTELLDGHTGTIDRIVQTIQQYDGGEVVLTATGENEALALARLERLEALLAARLTPAQRAGIKVTLMANPRASGPIVTLDNERVLLGTVLFNTDSAVVLPRYDGLLDELASQLVRHERKEITLIGAADPRGRPGYNLELGLRRARAVADALVNRLPANFAVNVITEEPQRPSAQSEQRSLVEGAQQ